MLFPIEVFLIYQMFIASYRCFQMNCRTFNKSSDNTNQTILLNDTIKISKTLVRSFITNIDKNLIFGRAVSIDNAYKLLEVLQAHNDDEGCANHFLSLPSETGADTNNCEMIINAGLFNTHTGECYGNVINKGTVFVNFNGIRNAHFGVKNDHSLFFGYLSKEEVLSRQFRTLVGGAIWLLKDGKSMVNKSISEECSHIQETGSLTEFASLRSARSAIGAFANGTVVIVQVGGRTSEGGIDLFALADLMASMGVVAAINLDGGGSSTMVINRTVVSHPSDRCGPLFTCERKVTTVLCVRAHCPHSCPPRHTCIHGFCEPFTDVTTTRTTIVILAVALSLSLALSVASILVYIIIEYRRRRNKSTKSSLYYDNNHDFVDNRPLMIGDDNGDL